MSYATKEQLAELAAYMASQIRVPTIGIGGGYAPIGTIISYMGTSAPQDYLACDGSVVNIADYPQLADFFESQFGSKNYFGGDGTTTFGVPDLQGEFLRGTGTNSHANQGSGANVGVHQDGTEHLRTTFVSGTGEYFVYGANEQFVGQLKQDSFVGTTTIQNKIKGTLQSITQDNRYTARPTNTSVLYCIKAVVAGDVYSTEERVVGTWIDGKPIYQKTYVSLHNANPSTVSDTIIIDISDVASEIEGVVNLDVRFDFLFNGIRTHRCNNTYYTSTETTQTSMWSAQPSYNRIIGNVTMNRQSQTLSDFNYYATIQYTKTDD